MKNNHVHTEQDSGEKVWGNKITIFFFKMLSCVYFMCECLHIETREHHSLPLCWFWGSNSGYQDWPFLKLKSSGWLSTINC